MLALPPPPNAICERWTGGRAVRASAAIHGGMGENVSHHGRVTVVDAKLYSLPKRPPRLLGAAVTESTAEFVGRWADGLLTVSGKPEQVRKVVDAFHRGGGEGSPC